MLRHEHVVDKRRRFEGGSVEVGGSADIRQAPMGGAARAENKSRANRPAASNTSREIAVAVRNSDLLTSLARA
jgi:hypothetical protein